MTNQGICHSCQYVDFSKQSSSKATTVPNTLLIENSEMKSSSTKNSSSSTSSPDSKKKPSSSNKRARSKTSTTNSKKPRKKKKKKNPAQTAELKEPDSDNQQFLSDDSDDESSEDEDSTIYKNLKRFELQSKRDNKLLFNIPSNKHRQVISLIRHHLGLTIPNNERNNEAKKSFPAPIQSFYEAKDYVIRTFFVFSNENEYPSLFQFKYLLSMSTNEDDEEDATSTVNNDIDIRYKDLFTLFDYTWLNDNIITFVLKCLNYVQMNQGNKRDAPSVLFGSPLDKGAVLINRENFSGVHKHINFKKEKSKLSYAQSEKVCELRAIEYNGIQC